MQPTCRTRYGIFHSPSQLRLATPAKLGQGQVHLVQPGGLERCRERTADEWGGDDGMADGRCGRCGDRSGLSRGLAYVRG